jgi:quercetin dioxygenase-like cupin family protein
MMSHTEERTGHAWQAGDAASDQKRPDPKKMAYFKFEEASNVYESDMVRDLGGPGAAKYVESLEAGGSAGALSRILFRHAGGEGMSILHVYLKPGLSIPRHSHDADCLYYVVWGELRMGKRRLGQGDGVYVPANSPYTVAAGPDVGAEFLEIRLGTDFDMQVRDDSDENWQQLIDECAQRKEAWEQEVTYPSRELVVTSTND